MALQLQLSDARTSQELRNVSTFCSSSEKFTAQINTVIRQLMKRGSWYGNEVLMSMCVQGCDITLPRHVRSVIGVSACGSQVPIQNQWYAIAGSGCCDVMGSMTTKMVDLGMYPMHSDITGTTGKQIGYHVTKANDVGKTIRIFGTKYGGQPLQEKDDDGNWIDGVTLTAVSGGVAGASMVKTTELVTNITHITREATQGMAYLYEYDALTGLRNLASFEPNETNPMYRRYRFHNISNFPSFVDQHGRTLRRVSCMVRLQFVPLANDNDFMLIDDLDALKYGVQATTKDEAGKIDEAEAYWAKAVRELNFAERSHNPGHATVVKVRAMGSNQVISNPI